MKYLFMVSSIKFSKFNQFSFVPYILLLYVSLLSIPIFAQVEAEILRPSINAEQFGFASKAEAALNKGQLSVNIPLMTLKGKGYDLPISLTFYNGDVNACTEASSIGLGWALNAGGVIAATIKGSDDIDDLTENGELNHFADDKYVEEAANDVFCFDKLDRIRWNSMPDEYTYSLPGHSGTIEISLDKNNTIKKTLFPDESYKIEDTKHGYCITADDGTKFYFEAVESRQIGSQPEIHKSTSYFLTEIKTTKGGQFLFEYDNEEYFDLSMIRDAKTIFDIYHTKRIKAIKSLGFGSVTFEAESRNDRGNIMNSTNYWTITDSLKSKRICKIELKDEDGHLVKGYELDNSGTFLLRNEKYEDPSNEWYDCRQKLSSITQYDAVGNKLPPYEFTYDYSLSKSYLQYYHNINSEYETPYDSWTSKSGTQVYVDLQGSSSGSSPCCTIDPNNSENNIGYTWSSGDADVTTAGDYFCLDRIKYPNGAIESFYYEPHWYGKINHTRAGYSAKVQGRRLASKRHYGADVTQRIDYVYKLHDTNYDIIEESCSGVLTNPSIHNATYYTPGMIPFYGWGLRASRISSGKPFNSFMGPPVCYTEVEEVEVGEYDNEKLSRTIHFFEPQIVSPPVNYLLYHPNSAPTTLIRIDNFIYGKKTGYSHGMESADDVDNCYIAYPVGEFCNIASVVDQPLKEVFIGKGDKIRSIKNYEYSSTNGNIEKKYGYKIVTPPNADCTLISKSEYFIRRTRLIGTTTTNYYYNDEKCDSTHEGSIIYYDKGRRSFTKTYHGTNIIDMNANTESISYDYPDNIQNITATNTSPSTELAATKWLIEKNIIADPIKTTISRNNVIIGGECKDYQTVSDSIPLLKSLYKIKHEKKYSSLPVVNGDTIDYKAKMYKEGEILTYDNNLNPEHVRLNDTQDRYYVWGYGGCFPIAVIDNIDDAAFANLKSQILQLEAYKKIETEEDCARLRNTNASIRNNPVLPVSAHITTYTYDPYFGMTSEIDDSNLGVIYTYDTFGRLTAKYDENYKKLEEYNYHLKLQE